MTYGLILAGGRGLRLYPLSRSNKPKQFLDILEGKSLLRNTLERVSKVIDSNKIYIVTNKDFKKDVIIESSKFIDKDNIIIEPDNKETAVCIALACVQLLKKDKDANIMIFPSDHYIESSNGFYDVINEAVRISNKKRGLITIGIKPNEPKTGYGYIQTGKKINTLNNIDVYKVDHFIEKPNFEIAKDFILKGNYLWNSGIFCFRADIYLRELEKYLPKIYSSMMEIYKSIGEKNQDLVINQIYPKLDGISIDFGIMQKTRRAYVIQGNFNWDDIGSFTSLKKILKSDNKNFITGKVLCQDSENCIVFGSKNLTITFGVKDLIVVNTDDVLLILDKNKEQEVKYISDILKGNEEFNKFI